MSPALYPILFDQIKAIVEKFFDQQGQVKSLLFKFYCKDVTAKQNFLKKLVTKLNILTYWKTLELLFFEKINACAKSVENVNLTTNVIKST